MSVFAIHACMNTYILTHTHSMCVHVCVCACVCAYTCARVSCISSRTMHLNTISVRYISPCPRSLSHSVARSLPPLFPHSLSLPLPFPVTHPPAGATGAAQHIQESVRARRYNFSKVKLATAFAMQKNIESWRWEFPSDSLADIKTLNDLSDYLRMVSEKARHIQPVSSNYFVVSSYIKRERGRESGAFFAKKSPILWNSFSETTLILHSVRESTPHSTRVLRLLCGNFV